MMLSHFASVVALILLQTLFFSGSLGSVHSEDSAKFSSSPNVAAVYALLERILPGSSGQFVLTLSNACQSKLSAAACFTMSDASAGQVQIAATSVSELTAACGIYLREWCNMTIGWPRGGGSRLRVPSAWPRVGSPVSRARIVPWSYIMNVCTHSYSLVWYSWAQWSAFIDWMALSGMNLALGLTGQEEVQYKVFRKLGLGDLEIRSWFNGRGQNEYGNNICGPLPRSWMRDQWTLQKQILARYRSLGIVSQLPGNVPWALAKILTDSNITRMEVKAYIAFSLSEEGDTGWMDSLDPNFEKIADIWMSEFIRDFGTDHWYQMDGYFDGGTAPWRVRENDNREREKDSTLPPCQWSVAANSFLSGCFQNCLSFPSLSPAQAYCARYPGCGGVTVSAKGNITLRQSIVPSNSSKNETAYYIANDFECHSTVPDPTWLKRGAAAYAGLARTDPQAIWSFQGWAFVDWSNALQAQQLRGFIASVPKGKFVVIDMSVNGEGEWEKFDKASFYGAPFIWTTLHDFGGTDGMKGNLAQINRIPFDGLAPVFNSTVWGTGYTPEGIDQNPVYYEFMAEANFRSERVKNITEHVILRSHRRYGLTTRVPSVASAWDALVHSTYSQDLSDGTGIPHIPGWETGQFLPGMVPTKKLCRTFRAWQWLISAAEVVDQQNEPYRYDLINLGREVLAQISTPLSVDFFNAFTSNPLNATLIRRTGEQYRRLLLDVDALVSHDSAFLLGPWIEEAKAWGANASDCDGWKTDRDDLPSSANCERFYEWNARVQLTSWNPVPKGAKVVPEGPVDYAGKHWSGLIRDFYHARAAAFQKQALLDASLHQPINYTALDAIAAQVTYDWQNAQQKYPTKPNDAYVKMSRFMLEAYKSYFASCN